MRHRVTPNSRITQKKTLVSQEKKNTAIDLKHPDLSRKRSLNARASETERIGGSFGQIRTLPNRGTEEKTELMPEENGIVGLVSSDYFIKITIFCKFYFVNFKFVN